MISLTSDGITISVDADQYITASKINSNCITSGYATGYANYYGHPERPTQCPNCGAPAKERECAYCGSILWN